MRFLLRQGLRGGSFAQPRGLHLISSPYQGLQIRRSLKNCLWIEKGTNTNGKTQFIKWVKEWLSMEWPVSERPILCKITVLAKGLWTVRQCTTRKSNTPLNRTIAATTRAYPTGQEVAPQRAQKATVGSTPSPCLTLANVTDTHTLEGAPDHQAYALKLRIMSSWVCEPKLVGFLAWGDRNTDARLCTCLCKHTHKKQNGELYKLKITHKPRYFCLISSVLFLSLGLSDG